MAQKRLMRDFKELTSEGVAFSHIFVAAPTEDDIFTWACKMRPTTGPYEGIVFYLRLVFNDGSNEPAYPKSPPHVELLTHLEHPNVFSGGFFGGGGGETEVAPVHELGVEKTRTSWIA